MSIENQLLYNNLIYAKETSEDIKSANTKKFCPKYPILILTCMDPEINVYNIFHLDSGDALILRNAGNVYSEDMKRSILIAIQVYDIKYILVLGHTGCSLTGLNMTKINEKLLPLFFNAFWKNQDNPMRGFRRYFKVFIDELRNIRDQIFTIKSHLQLPHDIQIVPLFYDSKSKLVFNLNELSGIEFIGDFSNDYNKLIKKRKGNYLIGDKVENPIKTVPIEFKKKKVTPSKETITDFQEEKPYDDFIDNYIKKFNIDMKKLQNHELLKKKETPLYKQQIYKKTRTIDQIKSDLALEGYKRMINNYLGDCNSKIEENFNKLLAYAKSKNICIEGFNDVKDSDIKVEQKIREYEVQSHKKPESKKIKESFFSKNEIKFSKKILFLNPHIFLCKTQLNFPKIYIPKITIPKFKYNNKIKKVDIRNE